MRYRTLSMVIVVCGALGYSGTRAQETAPADEFRAPVSRHALSTITPAEYAKVVRALGDPHPQVRDVATERLCLLDTSYLPQLAHTFQSESEFEVKRRIRYVVEYIFHRDQIAGQDGFLGVEIDRDALRVSNNPRTHTDELGISVKHAMDGFAARRAGMENGDIIIRLNGQPIPDDRTSTSFVKQVSSHTPGEKLTLTVLRLNEPHTIVAGSGERPTTLFDGAVLEPCILPVNENEPGYQRALRVLRIDPESPAATIGLPVRSCILAVNDQSLSSPRNSPEQILRTVVQDARRNTELKFRVAEAREVALNVTLGTRPVSLIRDPQVLEKARNRFVSFWKDQGGELLVLHHRRWQALRLDQLNSSGGILPEVGILP